MSIKKIPDFIEKRLLEEYREQGLCWRHDDDVFSKLTAILFPLSIGALTLPYLKVGVPKLFAVIGGLILMTFWYLSSESYEHRFKIRWTRIHEIEQILGLDSHLRMDRERSKSGLKGQHLRRCIFVPYLVVALLATCDIKVEATDPKVKVAHSVVQFIRVSSDPKVETGITTIHVWPPLGLWSTDAGIAKLVIKVETIVVIIVIAVGYLIYRKYRDRIRPNPENKA